VNWLVAIPIEWRLAVVLVAGAFLGAAANWATERLAWEPRSARRWFEIRPLLVMIFFAAGDAALYWWEIQRAGLLPPDIPRNLLPGLAAGLHAQWLCHTILVWFMLVASLIDADEKLIPDEITVPGTLFGLLTATSYPFAMLPVVWLAPNGQPELGFLHVTSPHPWPAWLQGFPHTGSLAIALALWWLWCIALMDRVWCASWGWSWAMKLFCAHLVRSPATWRLGALGLAGSPLIAGVWFWGDDAWTGLLTSLIGMAAGGGLIWMVRIVAAVVLKREAMGFGDVTLMAMIGSVLGWQSCLVIFFLAPFAGIFLGLLQFVLRRENEIPYGPFLSLATVVLIVTWCPIWSWLETTLLLLGGLVPLFVILCFPAMAFVLYFWRLLRDSFG
jgi:prepilin signal peptidase PulO-like enzyme (type II secretory pathway)